MSAHTAGELHAVADKAVAAPARGAHAAPGRRGMRHRHPACAGDPLPRATHAHRRRAAACAGCDQPAWRHLPIVDLRCRFGLDAAYNTDTATAALGGRTVGAVVDSVGDGVAPTGVEIKPVPTFSCAVDPAISPASRRWGDGERRRMLVLLDIEQPMGCESIGLLEPAQH